MNVRPMHLPILQMRLCGWLMLSEFLRDGQTSEIKSRSLKPQHKQATRHHDEADILMTTAVALALTCILALLAVTPLYRQ